MRKDPGYYYLIIMIVVMVAVGIIQIVFSVHEKNSEPTYSPYSVYRMRNETNYTTKTPSKKVTSTPRSTNKH